jgi:hypothetical protein
MHGPRPMRAAGGGSSAWSTGAAGLVIRCGVKGTGRPRAGGARGLCRRSECSRVMFIRLPWRVAHALVVALSVLPVSAAGQEPSEPAGAASPGAAARSGDCSVPEEALRDRPDADGPPTSVSVGVRLLDVSKIEDVDESVTLDLIVVQEWRDSRLASLVGCELEIAKIWIPDLTIRNSGRVFPLLPERAAIGPGGAVKYIQRYTGALAFPHHLAAFPFDAHHIGITLLSPEYSSDEVVLKLNEEVTGRAPTEFSIPNWTAGEPSATVGSTTIEMLKETHATYIFELPVKRRPEYFVFSVFVPLALIVAMSWSVFWISPERFGPQIGMSATAMLTLIAYQFAMRATVPAVSYMTISDEFMLGATLLVFLGLIQSVTTSFLVSKKRTDTAQRLDVHCRWVFPVAFLLLIVLVMSS